MEEQFVEFLSKVLQWFGRLAWLELVPMAPMRIIILLTGAIVISILVIILMGAIGTKAKHKQKSSTNCFSILIKGILKSVAR